MEITIQSLGFKAGERLESFVTEKLSKIEALNHNIVRANVTLFQDGADANDTNYCEIRLEAPGNDPFVKKNGAAFEQSVTEAVDALVSILRKSKEKLVDQQHGRA